MQLSNEEIKNWCDSRETSNCIARAIFQISESLTDAQKIWEDPEDKLDLILNIARQKNSLSEYSEDTLFWGCESFSA
jgi:hypothetical protein